MGVRYRIIRIWIVAKPVWTNWASDTPLRRVSVKIVRQREAVDIIIDEYIVPENWYTVSEGKLYFTESLEDMINISTEYASLEGLYLVVRVENSWKYSILIQNPTWKIICEYILILIFKRELPASYKFFIPLW